MSQGNLPISSIALEGTEPPLCVVTSVGTSLLTNLARNLAEHLRLRALAHVKESDLSAADVTLLDRLTAEAEAGLLAPGSAGLLSGDWCAELSGLRDMLVIQGHVPPLACSTLILVSTDTSLGRRVCQVLSRCLERLGLAVEIWVPTGFSAQTQVSFERGLRELDRRCHDALPGRRAAGQRVVFNLCGGFKGLVGCLAMCALIHADEVVFRFEGEGSELLRVPCPPLPIAPELFGALAPAPDRLEDRRESGSP